MTADTTERGLETHIAQFLVNENGYTWEFKSLGHRL